MADEHESGVNEDQTQNEILAKVREGKKLEAIRILREHSGMGLAECKTQIEALEDEMAANDPEFARILSKRRTGCLMMVALVVGGLLVGIYGAL